MHGDKSTFVVKCITSNVPLDSINGPYVAQEPYIPNLLTRTSTINAFLYGAFNFCSSSLVPGTPGKDIKQGDFITSSASNSSLSDSEPTNQISENLQSRPLRRIFTQYGHLFQHELKFLIP